ncbi:hypothetical protein K2X92_04850 [Candidatus Gracilibacteria bacterium]|nr:hypothetical protein [Candidatus Gracilibacteria bacterium]
MKNTPSEGFNNNKIHNLLNAVREYNDSVFSEAIYKKIVGEIVENPVDGLSHIKNITNDTTELGKILEYSRYLKPLGITIIPVNFGMKFKIRGDQSEEIKLIFHIENIDAFQIAVNKGSSDILEVLGMMGEQIKKYTNKVSFSFSGEDIGSIETRGPLLSLLGILSEITNIGDEKMKEIIRQYKSGIFLFHNIGDYYIDEVLGNLLKSKYCDYSLLSVYWKEAKTIMTWILNTRPRDSELHEKFKHILIKNIDKVFLFIQTQFPILYKGFLHGGFAEGEKIEDGGINVIYAYKILTQLSQWKEELGKIGTQK